MAVEVDPCHGTLAKAQIGAAVAGDETAQELEEVGVVTDDQNAFSGGILR